MENLYFDVYHIKHVKILLKNIINVDCLKPKIMKLTYIGKVALNIHATTIHLALVIPLNKNSMN
jgi:hypothetical protein